MRKILLILALSLLIPFKASANDLVDKSFIGAAQAHGIELRLLRAVCWVESSHKANLVRVLDGNNPSYGMCQVKLATARKNKYRGDARGLVYPGTNAFIAARELKRWLVICKGDWKRAVASYNKGHYSKARINGYVMQVTFALAEKR